MAFRNPNKPIVDPYIHKKKTSLKIYLGNSQKIYVVVLDVKQILKRTNLAGVELLELPTISYVKCYFLLLSSCSLAHSGLNYWCKKQGERASNEKAIATFFCGEINPSSADTYKNSN